MFKKVKEYFNSNSDEVIWEKSKQHGVNAGIFFAWAFVTALVYFWLYGKFTLFLKDQARNVKITDVIFSVRGRDALWGYCLISMASAIFIMSQLPRNQEEVDHEKNTGKKKLTIPQIGAITFSVLGFLTLVIAHLIFKDETRIGINKLSKIDQILFKKLLKPDAPRIFIETPPYNYFWTHLINFIYKDFYIKIINFRHIDFKF
jgi:hypothetical protein